MNNVIVANLAKGRKVITAPVFQWNHGMVLRFINAQLPDNFRVDFSNSTRGVAKSQMGTPENGVVIPDEYFMPGGAIYAWIVESPTEHSAVARWEITIPLDPKSKWVDVQPTPQEENIIDEAIHALNEAVSDAQEAISHYPKVVDGYWYVWDVSSGEYVSTGVQAQGPAGQDGDDGFSPTVTVTDITNGHRVTVTDADGDHTFDVMDGEDGQDGYSPTVTVTDITGGHSVTITDADHPSGQTFDVMDGQDGSPGPGIAAGGTTGQMLVKSSDADYATEWATPPSAPVQDVQADGTSILSNGVANIPIAGTNPGIAKVNSLYGITVYNKYLAISSASEDNVKSGTNNYKPIVPSRQKASAFYGLASAAGDSTQASSSNAVGTYTDNAKQAIREMLGAANENVKDQVDYAVRKTADLSSEGTADKYYDLNFAIGATSLLAQQTKAGYSCAMIECHAGDTFTLTAAIANSGGVVDDVVAWGFVQKTGPVYKLLDRGDLGVSANNKALVAPDDGYIVTNHYTSATYSLTASLLYKAVSDVQVNGTSVVSGGVANVPIMNGTTPGVATVRDGYDGLRILFGDRLTLSPTNSQQIKSGNDSYLAVTTARQHESTFYGLAKASGDTTQSSSPNAVGVYTETALSKISDMLNAPVSVSGSTPSITAMAGVRYVCGEVSTLAVTVPASGCVDIVFESGSTATVLTVTSQKTGVTAIKWANGWDGTCEANTTYEINILDGEYGVVGSWT